MNNYLYYLFLPTVIFFIVFFLNFLLIKKNFLLSQTGDPHQKFANKKNIPLIGGILIYLCIIYLFFNDLKNVISILFLVIFLLGLFSDLKLIKSALVKLLLQISIIYFAIYIGDISLTSLRMISSGALNFLLSSLAIILTDFSPSTNLRISTAILSSLTSLSGASITHSSLGLLYLNLTCFGNFGKTSLVIFNVSIIKILWDKGTWWNVSIYV